MPKGPMLAGNMRAMPKKKKTEQLAGRVSRAPTISTNASSVSDGPAPRRGSNAPAEGTPEDQEAKWVQEEIGNSMLTNIKTPEWVEMLLAVSRISYLQYLIEEEREERKQDTYQNPYEECYRIVTTTTFEGFIGLAILTNCMFIGWQASVPEDELVVFFNAVEHIYVFIFLFEWILRMLVFGWIWTFEIHNAADTFLVFGTGVIPKWIMEPLGFSVGNFRILTCVRALRLIRIVRAVRMMPQFRELWVLIQGLVQSLRPLLWTGVIAMMILYIFGVAATELIGRQADFADDEYAQELFGDPVRSMFTMFQMMTMDSWAYGIARPVMRKQWNLCFFFVFFIMVAVFVFWNLITAVIVENAMNIVGDDATHKSKEADHQKKQELKTLADLFMEIDTDGTGDLGREEFFEGLKNEKVRRILDLLEVKITEAEEIWNVLDDGDGVLTIKEFTSGIRRMKGDAKAKDIVDIVKKLRQTSQSHKVVKAQVEQFGGTLRELERDVERIQTDTGEMLGLFHEMHHRLEAHIKRTHAEDRARAALMKQRLAEQDDEDNEEGEGLEVEDLT